MLLNAMIHAFRVWLVLGGFKRISYAAVLSAMLRANFYWVVFARRRRGNRSDGLAQ